uniref:Sulfotransferase n=1 Tax=Kalanchoe fedtschenkoi TaxID=63787 RepID=A0A7N0TAL8_KALFE
MGEDLCFLNKGLLTIKIPKRSPLLMRTMVLLFAMACGVYMCSICLRQISTDSEIKIQDIQVIQMPSSRNCADISEHPFAHYPKPETFNRAECTCNPVRFFAILSMQRSGSGWFETLLNSHVNVSSNGEIFTPISRRDNASAVLRTLDTVYNLDLLTSASKNECAAAVGFKWMLNQGLMDYHEDISEYFNRRGVSVIFLFRRNLLRRLVSVLANSYDRYAKLLNGTHKSHVHTEEEAQALSNYKPIINSTSLVSDLQLMRISASKAVEYFNGTRYMIVYYEDLITNRTLLDVQNFLFLPPTDLTSRQVKIHKGPLSEHVKNWDEVNKTLKGTPYESFLLADY